MKGKRRKFSSAFKAKVALEALKVHIAKNTVNKYYAEVKSINNAMNSGS